MRIWLIAVMIGLVALIGCANKDYEQAVADGQTALEEADYAMAIDAFERALKEKANDDKATALLDQTEAFLEAYEQLTAGELKNSKSAIESVRGEENGSELLVKRAEDMQGEIEMLEEKYEEYTAVYGKAETAFVDNQFDESTKLIETVLEDDMTHALFNGIQTDFQALLGDVKNGKKASVQVTEEDARKKKEAEENKRQDAEEQGEVDETAKEGGKEEQKIASDAFVGYWLNTEENIASHMTMTYTSSAMPYSDFITHDEISAVTPLSASEINITFSDGTTSIFTLSNNNSTLKTPGLTFQRVSKKEANAIFDGHFELP